MISSRDLQGPTPGTGDNPTAVIVVFIRIPPRALCVLRLPVQNQSTSAFSFLPIPETPRRAFSQPRSPPGGFHVPFLPLSSKINHRTAALRSTFSVLRDFAPGSGSRLARMNSLNLSLGLDFLSLTQVFALGQGAPGERCHQTWPPPPLALRTSLLAHLGHVLSRGGRR